MQHYIPLRLFVPRSFLPGLLTLNLLVAGCTPLSEAEKDYIERRKTEREQKNNFARDLSNGEISNDMINKVKSLVVEDGLTTEVWAKLKVSEVQSPAQVVFQKWTAVEKSAGVFEVRFAYTILDQDNEPQKRGFLWSVDKTLDKISGPAALAHEDLQPTYKKRGRTSEELTRDQNKWSLE